MQVKQSMKVEGVKVERIEYRNPTCDRLHFEDGTHCYTFADGEWQAGIKKKIRGSLPVAATISFNRTATKNKQRFQYDIFAAN